MEQATNKNASERLEQQKKEFIKNTLLIIGGGVVFVLLVYAIVKSCKAAPPMSLAEALPLIESI